MFSLIVGDKQANVLKVELSDFGVNLTTTLANDSGKEETIRLVAFPPGAELDGSDVSAVLTAALLTLSDDDVVGVVAEFTGKTKDELEALRVKLEEMLQK